MLRTLLLCWLPVTQFAGAVFGAETATPGEQPLKYEEPRHLAAAIYAPDKKLLFNFTRDATRSGSTLAALRD